MPTLALTNFNIVVSVLGGWISLFGLVSYLCKESFYLSEACTCALPSSILLFSIDSVSVRRMSVTSCSSPLLLHLLTARLSWAIFGL